MLRSKRGGDKGPEKPVSSCEENAKGGADFSLASRTIRPARRKIGATERREEREKTFERSEDYHGENIKEKHD